MNNNILSNFKVLTIDIGGTHIKATVLNQNEEEVAPYKSIETPKLASPENVLEAIGTLVKDVVTFDYVSAGFPGFVKEGIIQTAPNLGSDLWANVNFEDNLSTSLGKPSQVVNDADLQGIGVVSGVGFEILITLGTGFGSAFLKNGILFPHIELAHHPIKKGIDYDKYIGDKSLKNIGDKKWNKRMKKVLNILKTVFNYDRLYISGGNAQHLNFELGENIHVVTNEDGIKGGVRLWTVNHKTEKEQTIN